MRRRQLHTVILGTKRDEEGKITNLEIAVVFVQAAKKALGQGQLAFHCPFCRTIHYYHAGDPVFGNQNGPHSPQCHDPAYGLHSLELHNQLAQDWFFDFLEVSDHRHAGPFPSKMHKALKQYAVARLRLKPNKDDAFPAGQREEA